MTKLIENISPNTEQAILRKTAYGLPDRPSESGMRTDEIKKAFYSAITDKSDSVLSELKRVVNEANEVIGDSCSNIITNVNSMDAVIFSQTERQKSKNLCSLKDAEKNSNGVSINFNSSTQRITLNGTSTAVSESFVWTRNLLPNIKNANGKTCTVSVTVESGSYTGLLEFYLASNDVSVWDDRFQLVIGEPRTITLTNNNVFDTLYIYMDSTVVANNLVLKVQIEEGSQATDWQYPYGQIVHEKEIQKNIITTISVSQFILSAVNTYEIIPLTTNKAQVGNKLTLNNDGTITIGSDVSYIKASAFINIVGSTNTGTCYIKISKNNELTVLGQVYIEGSYPHNLRLTEFLIPVQENDIISLQAYVNNVSNTIGDRTYMTMEVVE